jgi:hydroxymethylglutaryl-CoA synthase
MRSQPNILQFVKDGNIDADAYPLSIQLLKEFRNSKEFGALVAAKMSLGSEPMKDIGNVYCAALPAWMAAGLEDAYRSGVDLAGRKVLAVGYGSGDAAEALPMTVTKGWRHAAAKIGFEAALTPYQDLTQAQYENLHDTGTAQGLRDPDEGFVIQSIGSSANPKFSDEGIEYYRFVR